MNTQIIKKQFIQGFVCTLAVCIFCAVYIFFPSKIYAETPEYDGEPTTLCIYNWGQYMADGSDGYLDVIDEFNAIYPDIKINYMTYESNEAMYTKLQTSGGDFDLLIPSDYMIEKLIAEDMLEPLDFSNIPNFSKVDDFLKDMEYDPGNIYSVPYTWGYVGIIYNKLFVDPSDVGSWDLLWNPKYSGKILMFDNCRDAFAISEFLLGYDINTEDPHELKAAADKLSEGKALVQSYVMDQVFDKMERGEAWIAPYYAGDFPLMYEENKDLGFYCPKEGYNFFVDACCIPKGAKHKKEAELFINFLCEPQISGPNLEYLSYSTPISEAKEYMDEDFANNEVIFPSEDVISRAESFKSLSSDGTRMMNDLWLEVKTSNSLLLSYLIPMIVVIALITFIWLYIVIRKKWLKSGRCTH